MEDGETKQAFLVALPLAAFSIDAVKRAAYAMMARVTVSLEITNAEIRCTLVPISPSDTIESLERDFRREVLDHDLRIHKQTIPRLKALAEFLTRNLLFVDHVALMGLEMTGFTKANLETLWIDPADYADELKSAAGILTRAKMKVSVYNTQLCLIDRSLWPLARQSISDWKREYMPECHGCDVKDQCGGFFSSASLRYSEHIKPVPA